MVFGFRRKERNPEREGRKWKSQSLRILFWVSVLFQVIDVFVLKFNRANGFPISVLMYTIIAFWAFFVFKNEKSDSDQYEYSNSDYEKTHHFLNPKHILLFLMFSAFYIIVPFFFWLIPQISLPGGLNLAQWINFLLAILPIWPIYIGMKGKSAFVHIYVNIWIIIILAIFVFGFATNLSVGDIAAIGGRPSMIDAGPVFQFIVDQAANVWKNIVHVTTTTVRVDSFFGKLANVSGLNYYYGMNDKSDSGPVGLYIDNVRTIERYSYEDTPVVIWADLRGKSFTEEIRVRPSCYIEKVGPGEPDPKSFSVLGEEHDTLSCTFDSVPKGSYRAKVGATFNFETWAYVTYTFVDQEIKRSLEIQGKNVNSELDISIMPLAVYSNGPVMLGMGAQVDQPVGVDRISNSREPVLGVTVENNGGGGWTEGQAVVNEFEIQVPNDFSLINCDRWYPDKIRKPDSNLENYDIYIFKKEMSGDLRQEYKSVTCRLHIKDPDKLLSGSQKVQRTFVSRVKYNYELEKSISVTVREG
jgi:hypothetical protein